MSKQEKSQEVMFSKIREWQASGLSQKSFCEQFEIAYGNFHYWYKRFREVDPPSTASFVPLQIQDTGNSIFASVVFSGGGSIQLYQAVSPDYLKKLLS